MHKFRGKLKDWSKSLARPLDKYAGSHVEPHNDPSLCSFCANITWKSLEGSYAHQPDYWSLKESAQTCPLCNILLRSLQTEDELPAINESELDKNDSSISLDGSRLPDGDSWEDQLFLKCGNRFKIIDIHVHEGADKSSSRRIQDRADSDTNFEWLKEQLNACQTTHKGCSLGDPHATPLVDPPQKLPTRVIDVGSPDGSDPVKLIETGRKPGQYVALSHCWGKKQIITTTKDSTNKEGVFIKGTLEQHYNEIPYDQLSKTFQDAVVVCRKLAMRYLWIDSLCIIQNDGDDWAAESSYMGDIYRTATFSIMAAGADAGAIGCFIPRARPALEPVRVEYTVAERGLESVTIGLPKGSLHAGLEDGPLQSRSWCLQERVLSRRSIHFCKDHIVWECQMSSIAEDGTHLDGASGMEAYQIKLHDNMGTGSHLRNPLQGRWRRIVQDYTHRDITKVTDKLPAISGLAQKVYAETGDAYAAGLWQAHLHNDLFWFAEDHMEPALPYRAPSWSWAAYDGPISYNEVFDMKTIYFNTALQDVNVSTHPTTVNAFGEIDAGRLTFRARVRSAIYSADAADKGTAVTQHAKHLYNVDRSYVRDSHGNTDSYGIQLGFGAIDGKCDEEVVVDCLSIAVKADAPGPWHIVLLVKSTGTEGEYRRIGAAKIRPLNWFDNVEYRSITLV